MDYWAAKLIDDLHPYRTVKGSHAPGLGQRIGYGVNSQDAVGIAQAYQASRIADALERIGDQLSLHRDLASVLERIVQGIEARQGGNGEAGAVHESPVGVADAPEPQSDTPDADRYCRRPRGARPSDAARS
jgi:hypothetical protein